ncbi:MAG: PD-(D/E)XK nuclease family protein [Planctomycetota bacterium]|nr:PD-(D/E)XK nuclease family protein [Planctomycetota bacterium]
MAELKNEFTWSASRARTYDYCPRQYWWNYYGSWGGWDRKAAPEPREAYMLKNLANRWTWPGTVVHDTIESILRGMQAEAGQGALGFAADVSADDVVERATKTMRRQWEASRSADYRRRPKKAFGLVEHEYGDEVSRAEWKAVNQKVRDALRAFLGSDLFARIRASDPSTWLPIETLDKFDFEGTGVWAVLDFAWRLPDGSIEIYDWKTGEVNPDSNMLQLGCYALYVQQRHGVEAEQVATHLVYLGETMQDMAFRVTEPDLKATRGEMRASIAAMRTRLRDKPANVAVREDFALTDDLEKCRTCAYRRLCGRGS